MERNRIKVECNHCGAELERRPYEVKHNKTHHCDRDCYYASMRKSVEVTCDGCGATVTRWPSEIGDKNFCSRSCYEDQRRGNDLNCSYCGSTYYRPPSQVSDKSDRNYCSRDCYDADPEKPSEPPEMTPSIRRKLSKWRKGKTFPHLRKDPVIKTCEQCQRQYEATPGSYGKKKQRFCSTDCWYEYMRENPEETPSYIDGSWRSLRGRHPWPQQRAKALERDGHECTECGDEHHMLHVHHIIPVEEFGEDAEAAHDLGNLRTLCPKCHMRTHGLL